MLPKNEHAVRRAQKGNAELGKEREAQYLSKTSARMWRYGRRQRTVIIVIQGDKYEKNCEAEGT